MPLSLELLSARLLQRVRLRLTDIVLILAKRRPPCEAHFATFADAKYARALRRIEREAARAFRPGCVHVYDESDLDDDFRSMHANFVRDNPRGYGYWLWKPYIVGQTLTAMRDGEILVYADAGCMINVATTAAARRLKELVAMATARVDGIITFLVPNQYNPREGRWTKREALIAFGVDDSSTRASRQIMATAFVIKNTARNRTLVDEWYRACSRYTLVDDTLTTSDQHPEFVQHRHDQSLFSLLLKTTRQDDVVVLEDEIETLRWCDPIWAKRRKY